ncbi:MAG: hypothetical protein HKN25_07785 [Pyrinomonadaceae bacterium]|nr:hypothetical protein [Pyrinomonadaceae bacterium]
MVKHFAFFLLICGFLLTACQNSETANSKSDQNGSKTNNSSDENPPNSGGADSKDITDKNSESYAPPVFNGTTKKTSKRNNLESPAILADVRTGKHDGFDRAVFEFKGADLPGYYIEYIGEPITQCGSGTKVDLTGNGGLEIRFSPAQAHTDAGQPTIFFSDNEQNPNYTNIKKLKSTCDFEGNVTWVVGVSKANKYRVLTLENPSRLVVDVEH